MFIIAGSIKKKEDSIKEDLAYKRMGDKLSEVVKELLRRDHFGDQIVDRRTLFKLIFKKYSRRMWTRFILLRRWTNDVNR
jgi:hypothetical protein